MVENGVTTHIGQMRHFLAWELAPNLRLKAPGSIGIYVLDGYGLREIIPGQLILLRSMVPSAICGSVEIAAGLSPAVYYLNVDGKKKEPT